MHSRDTGNVSLYKVWSCVALNYRLHKRMYGVVKTSGNEEGKKNGKRRNLAVARANISWRKAEEKDRTFLHFIMRLTSSFLPINFREYEGAAEVHRRDGKRIHVRPGVFSSVRESRDRARKREGGTAQARGMLTEHVTSLSGMQFRDIKVWRSPLPVLAIKSPRSKN